MWTRKKMMIQTIKYFWELRCALCAVTRKAGEKSSDVDTESIWSCACNLTLLISLVLVQCNTLRELHQWYKSQLGQNYFFLHVNEGLRKYLKFSFRNMSLTGNVAEKLAKEQLNTQKQKQVGDNIWLTRSVLVSVVLEVAGTRGSTYSTWVLHLNLDLYTYIYFRLCYGTIKHSTVPPPTL